MKFGNRATLIVKKLRLKRNKDFVLSVDHLSLDKGRITGVVGANGSGKTSLVESIVGLAKLDAGNILVNGCSLLSDDKLLRSDIGYIPDDDEWLVPELTAGEYFELLQDIYQKAGVKINMERSTAQLAKFLQFTQFNQQLGTLSHGNKKKIQIIAALMHKPKLVVVDELRNGLDPIAIKTAENIIKWCATNGAAVLAASHDLWWAERMADDIVMLNQGQIILRQPTKAIVAKSGSIESKFMEMFKAYAT